MRFLVVFAFIELMALSSGSQTEGPPVMTVCDVVRNLFVGNMSFLPDDRIVAIRGQWDGLVWDDCPSFQTSQRTWPNALWVVFPSDHPSDRADLSADWETTFDRSVYSAALDGAWSEWERLPDTQKDQMTVMATISGRLDVHRQALADEFDSTTGIRLGLGFQGYYPAQLMVIGIRDIAIVPAENRVVNPPDRR